VFRPYGSNRGWFVANYESFKIEKKSTYNYNVTFVPEWIGESKALLILKILETDDIIEYELFGTSTPPLAT